MREARVEKCFRGRRRRGKEISKGEGREKLHELSFSETRTAYYNLNRAHYLCKKTDKEKGRTGPREH